MKVAVILWGPTQVGKSSMMASVLDPDQGAAPEIGDGSGESVTCTTDLRNSAFGPLLDCPGINDSRLLFTNEEAGSRVAVGVAEHGVGLLKFLVFESMSSDSVQLRSTLAALMTTFGRNVMDGVVVLVSKADMRRGAAREKRLTQIRKIMDEQGLQHLMVWQSEGLDEEQHRVQCETCKSALGQVREVATNELDELWEQQKLRAEHLFHAQTPHIQEVEVDEEYAESYDAQESYEVQEPYQDFEMQTVMVKQAVSQTHQTANNYTWHVEVESRGLVRASSPHGGSTWQHVIRAFHDLDENVSRRDFWPYFHLGYRADEPDDISFKVSNGSKNVFHSWWMPHSKSWSRDIPRREPGSFETRLVEEEVPQQVRVPVTKCKSVTRQRTVTRYRTATRRVTKPIEMTRPMEGFFGEALQQVVEEIRSTFRISPSEVSMDIHPEDSISEIGGSAAIGCQHVGESTTRDAPSSAAVDAESCESLTDVASWVSDSAEQRCFMSQTLLKTAEGFCMQCKDLRPGSRVIAADGSTILEVIHVSFHETDRVIILNAGHATLRVTPSHRVVAFKQGSEADTEEVCAGDLKEGRRIMSSGRVPLELTDVLSLSERCEVAQISFHPDLPVGAFEPPAAILTKGHLAMRKPVRRGGMNRRSKINGTREWHVSIPDTALGEYAD